MCEIYLNHASRFSLLCVPAAPIHCTECMQWSEALGVLAAMEAAGCQPVTRTYNTLMIACNAGGQWQQALGVHQRMLAAGQACNTTTYNALITAHGRAGHFHKVRPLMCAAALRMLPFVPLPHA